MKTIVLTTLIFIFICEQLFSQSFNLQFIKIASDGFNGGNFDIKIQIQGNELFKLASSNITINFLPSRINNPSLLVAHNFDDNVEGTYNNMTLTEPNSGVASINIVFPLTNSTLATDVSTTWKDVSTIRFKIVDSTLTSLLNFRYAEPSPTIVFKCTGTGGVPPGGTFAVPQLAAGTWYSLDVPLPVELSSFTASIDQNIVNLKWQTKTEMNNYGFEVERASSVTSPSKVWEKIGFIEGSGNSISPKDYSFNDFILFGGSKLIYRLKQIDLSGSFEYSDEVEVELAPSEFSLYQNYPNPFNPITNIKLAVPKAAKINLIVYNLLGEMIAILLDENKETGFYDVQFDASSLSSGIYIYKLTADDFIQTKKMIVIK
jgi:hypothetical protein